MWSRERSVRERAGMIQPKLVLNEPLGITAGGIFSMFQDIEQPIQKLTARLFTLPVGNYLVSENFSQFCRQYDLEDLWKEYRVVSRDRPELYGHFVIKNAFVLLLHHIFHSRPDEFIEVVTQFLLRFSQKINVPLPLNDLKRDLMDLGYPEGDLEPEFSILRRNDEDRRKCMT
jgi:hypothetical protein